MILEHPHREKNFGGLPLLEHIMQRLDVGTSGLMVVAKSEPAYTALKRAFRSREVEKTYHTLVQGHPDPFEGTVEAPIGRHPGARQLSTGIIQPGQA